MCVCVLTSLLTSLPRCHTPPLSHACDPPSFEQHFDKVGKYQLALDLIDEALKHTPTVIEVYMWRARVLKHAGQLEAASETLEYARKMDLADRYVNWYESQGWCCVAGRCA